MKKTTKSIIQIAILTTLFASIADAQLPPEYNGSAPKGLISVKTDPVLKTPVGLAGVNTDPVLKSPTDLAGVKTDPVLKTPTDLAGIKTDPVLKSAVDLAGVKTDPVLKNPKDLAGIKTDPVLSPAVGAAGELRLPKMPRGFSVNLQPAMELMALLEERGATVQSRIVESKDLTVLEILVDGKPMDPIVIQCNACEVIVYEY